MVLLSLNQPIALSQQAVSERTVSSQSRLDSRPNKAIPNKAIRVESAGRLIDERKTDLRIACLRIPSSLVTAEAREGFQHTSSVDRMVLGTHARGVALCQGDVRAELRNHVGGVEVLCCISGVVTSSTYGVNGPATIASRSNSSFSATKRIFFDGRRLTSQPVNVDATTRVQIDGIGSTAPRLRGRLIRSVASRRAAASLPEAEAITRQLTVNELQQRIDTEFDSRLASLNRRLAKRLSIMDAVPLSEYELSISSNPEFIEIRLTHNDNDFDERSNHACSDLNSGTPLPALPASENVVLWIQLPEMSLVGIDTIASWGWFRASNYLFPTWLSAPLSNTPTEVATGMPFGDVLRHENWIGFQFDHDQRQD